MLCLTFNSNLGKRFEGEKEKKVSAEKMKSANISKGRQQVQNIMEGATGRVHQKWERCTSPATHLSPHSKHTPHSDLCLSDKAKCSYLPPPRNIRYTSSKRCKIARKVIDEQRKRKSSANLLLISRKSWIEEKEIDEVLGVFRVRPS